MRSRRGTPSRLVEGFTLIELMVVIIIIGILSAIAIPVFLHQRKKGWDAAAKQDLRNLAGFQEIYFLDTQMYGTIAEIQALEPKAGSQLTYDDLLDFLLQLTGDDMLAARATAPAHR